MGRALAGVVQLRQLENGEWRPFASGIVIDRYWILTAGHAAVSVSNRKNLQVCLWLNETMDIFEVEEIRKNSGYLSDGFDQQDMAAVKLASPVPTDAILPLLTNYHWYSTRWQNRNSPLTAVGRIQNAPTIYDNMSLSLAPHDGTGQNGKIAFQLQGGFADGCSGGALLAHQKAGYLGVIGMIIQGGSLYHDTAGSSFVLGNDLLLPWLTEQGIPHATRDAKACFSAFQWTPLQPHQIQSFLTAGQMSELLNWNGALSTLVGREEEMRVFNQWLESDDALQRLQCRLVYGEGGVGKTRFIKQWADQVARQQHWQVVDTRVNGVSKVADLLAGSTASWLIVIDYPELEGDLAAHFREWKGLCSQVWVVLLSRYGDSYWEALKNCLNPSEMVWEVGYEFKPLLPEQSHTLLCQVLRALGASPERIPLADYLAWMETQNVEWRTREALRYPLMTVGQGLCLALEPDRDFRTMTHQNVLEALVKREWRHLEGLVAPLALKGDQRYGVHLLQLLAILLGPIHRDTLQLLAEHAPQWLPSADEIEHLLGDEGLNLLTDEYLQPMVPDVFATAFAVEAFNRLHPKFNRGRRDGSGFLELLGLLLDHADMEKALSVFAQRRFDASHWLAQSLDTVYEQLQQAFAVKTTRYKCALAYFSRGYSALPELGSQVWAWIVESQRCLADDDFTKHGPGLAISLNNFSNLLAASGNLVDGLEACQEAVAIRRTLAEANWAVYGPAVANSLNNLSILLVESGDSAGAIEACQEAVRIYRMLAGAAPAEYDADLAMGLNNLSIWLSKRGDGASGLEASREAVALYRSLSECNPATYCPALANSLNNLSNRLVESGDRAGGLDACQEAVAIRRTLAEPNMAAYGSDLAMSLHNLSDCLAKNDDEMGGLEASREAVTIFRTLADVSPEAYGHSLASSLFTLSIRLVMNGDWAGGLDANREAVTIRRALAESNWVSFGPDLAVSLTARSVWLSESGDRAGGLDACQEAVVLYRRLVETNPAAYGPDLAYTLNKLSIRLVENGDRAGALNASQEAVALYRTLAETNLAMYGPALAANLNNLAVSFAENKRLLEAATTQMESLHTYQECCHLHGLSFQDAEHFNRLLGGLIAQNASNQASENFSQMLLQTRFELLKSLTDFAPEIYQSQLDEVRCSLEQLDSE